MHIPNAEWVFLRDGQGLADVQKKLMNNEWHRDNVKIVILITGQAEASARHQAMSNSVTNALLSVKFAYGDAVILLCSPIPHPRDGPLVLKDLEILSDIMHEACTKEECLEYSSLGSYFYGKFRLSEARAGVPSSVLLIKSALMDAQGLTLQGSRIIEKWLIDKVKTANLYERYVMLNAKLIDL